MVDPIDYSGGNGFLQGLQTAGAYQQVQQQRAAAEQAQQQQAALQQFQKDWQLAYASGDPKQLDALMAKYPGQMETIQKAIGFRDDNHRMALGNAARDLRVAMSSGNPEAVAMAAQTHADTLGSVGATPQEIMQQFQQDPKGLLQTVDTVGMGALGVKDYFGVQNDQAQRQNDRDKLAEQVRSNKAGEGLQARGQDIQIRGQNISASNSAADRDLKRLMLQEQVISNRLGQAKTELETQNLAAKLDSNKREQQELQQQKQTSLSYAAEASALAKSLASDPNLGDVTGTINTWTPVVKDSSQDVLNTANRLHSLLTSDNLKLMSGILTDKDITFLGNIASGLNITDKGIKGSEESIKKRLGAIAERIDNKLKAQSYSPIPNSTPQTATTDAQQQAGFSSLWGE